MNYQSLLVEIRNNIGIVWMNRPESDNALDGTMITEMNEALCSLNDDPEVRIVVIAGTGDCFCAGIDRTWVERVLACDYEQNRADAMKLATLLNTVYTLKKPTVARVHGAAVNGGAGLVAACDMAVAIYDVDFRLDLVRFGLIPATIAPYLIRAMGERMARHYMLTGAAFTAAEAYRTGLLTDIVPDEELDARINELLGHLIQGAPEAQVRTKEWIRATANLPITTEWVEKSASCIAEVSVSEECRGGLEALLSKRKQPWLIRAKQKVDRKKAATGAKAADKAAGKGKAKPTKTARKGKG